MSIKSEAAEIQQIIDKYQWKVVEMDEDLNYYFIYVPDMTCNPMVVKLLRRRVPESEEIVGQLEIDLLDILLPSKKFEDSVEAERQRLINTNAPKEQVDELMQVKDMFGI